MDAADDKTPLAVALWCGRTSFNEAAASVPRKMIVTLDTFATALYKLQ